MSSDLGQKIKEVSEIEFPSGLHGRIMRQLVFLKFRTPFLIVVTLLLLNLVLSGIRVWNQLLDAEAVTIFSILWDGIEWSFVGLGQFARDLFELVPVGQLGMLAINCAALLYIVYFFPRAMRRFGSQH